MKITLTIYEKQSFCWKNSFRMSCIDNIGVVSSISLKVDGFPYLGWSRTNRNLAFSRNR